MKLSANEIIQLTQAAVGSLLKPGVDKSPLPKIESNRYPKVYVFRHGETYDNKEKIFSGWRDSLLTPEGIKQAKVLQEKLKSKKIDVCIVSSLTRSRETAEIVFAGRSINFEVDDRIIERNYGDLTGKNKEKLMNEDFVKAVKYRRFYDFPIPNGESLKEVKKRVFPFCDDLVKRVRETGENIAISCHGNSMKAIRLYFERLPVIEVLVQENPLGKDYAQYVITPGKIIVGKS